MSQMEYRKVLIWLKYRIGEKIKNNAIRMDSILFSHSFKKHKNL